ncbi:MAG TPA: heparan-alpha-glucosaminide N-acetyltransferase [Methanospirillum sp.]|uniref:heparan-alpha-glucosaminide N-acetyltransferase n=1 Tax=Methanospirillum sp. TaxID=45200 RepID=UPI002CDE3B79|nr:heparan-alpha-glucosaminide N-acetyltransferase [Methanospirillum sp.]HOJ96318.1 heparan-alpha-glucosaminide N-acetyltransferase [Methanospirillum sp.]HPP79033.1 heparan-alpha-glucosaminide N-acetyltransferase [Methanospirillum sp.]
MELHHGRYPGLDACRGIAILMMVSYHFFVDLDFIGIPGPDPFSSPLKCFGVLTTISFIGIAGISAHLKSEKTHGFMKQIRAFLKRGGELLLIGVGISLITWWVMQGVGYVVFGILHLIGTALILTPFLYRLGHYGLLLAAGLIMIAVFGLPAGPLWLAWIGICPVDFYSVDYTPVIPWLSVFIFGLSTGRFFFPSGYPRYFLNTPEKPVRCLAFLGRHSLVIYLIHQPVLFLLILTILKIGG